MQRNDDDDDDDDNDYNDDNSIIPIGEAWRNTGWIRNSVHQTHKCWVSKDNLAVLFLKE